MGMDAIGHCQLDWLANLLLVIYECKKYFHCWLSKQDLLEGKRLANLLMTLNQEVACCTLLVYPICLKSLVGIPTSLASSNNKKASWTG